MTDKINYVEAFNELQLIVQEIEDGEITVDELALIHHKTIERQEKQNNYYDTL